MIEVGSKRRRWIIVGCAGVLPIAVVIFVFLAVGDWLVVQDPLTRADIIVVLSGRLPERALEAARIYHGGYATQIWISQPTSPVDEMKQMNIIYLGEDFYNEKVLLAKGVPADAIRILDEPSFNTEEEVREISATMRREMLHNAIIVTSKPHTRRVRTIWRKLVGSDPHLAIRFAADDSYDGRRWWHHSRDALDVVRETLGLLNAWAGFPARPSSN